MQVLVHGGAGRKPADPAGREAVLAGAAERGAAAESPLEAVVEAVSVLESAPAFNAGVGSAVQADGRIRTDAGVMTGDGTVGAACAMPGVEHAVAVARVVATETPHVCVAGEHAVALGAAFGVETGVDLRTERSRERWVERAAAFDSLEAIEEVGSNGAVRPPEYSAADVESWLGFTRAQFGDESGDRADEGSTGAITDGTDHDTVGAVAVDDDGRLAAATSTGGRWFAYPGRVGDVPQVGSGFFCTPVGAVSATGAGEDIARVTLSRLVVDGIESGLDPDTAADRAIERFADRTDSTAGVIAIDATGSIGTAYNSEAMQTASAESGG